LKTIGIEMICFPAATFVWPMIILKTGTASRLPAVNIYRYCILAAMESETRVESVLKELLDTAEPITYMTVKDKMCSGQIFCSTKDVHILKVDLIAYDALLEQGSREVANG